MKFNLRTKDFVVDLLTKITSGYTIAYVAAALAGSSLRFLVTILIMVVIVFSTFVCITITMSMKTGKGSR